MLGDFIITYITIHGKYMWMPPSNRGGSESSACWEILKLLIIDRRTIEFFLELIYELYNVFEYTSTELDYVKVQIPNLHFRACLQITESKPSFLRTD